MVAEAIEVSWMRCSIEPYAGECQGDCTVGGLLLEWGQTLAEKEAGTTVVLDPKRN